MRPIYLISKTPHPGVIHIPILKISFLQPDIDFTKYHGIILTSKQAVLALEHYSFEWERLTCVCVSEGTADAARKAGAVTIETGDGYGTSLPKVLKAHSQNQRWLYLRPKVIASDWVETARQDGIHIDEAIVYETTCNDEAQGIWIEENAILVFTSPSSITCFCKSYSILSTHTVVAIGKTTRDTFANAKEVLISPQNSVASAVELAQKIAHSTLSF